MIAASSGPETCRARGVQVIPCARASSAPGNLGTQVVKIFDQAAARTGLRDHEATAAGYNPVTVQSEADDHKAYYPGSHRITIRVTGDRTTGRLLGMQLFGHKNAEIAKRGIAFRMVEARSTVRDILRIEGVEEKVGRIDRFTMLADAIDAFQNDTPTKP